MKASESVISKGKQPKKPRSGKKRDFLPQLSETVPSRQGWELLRKPNGVWGHFCKIFVARAVFSFTEWQARRVTEVDGHYWKLPSPTPLLKQNQLEQVARDCAQWGLNISNISNISLANPCCCLITLTVKKFFLTLRGSFLCFNLCLLPLDVALGTSEKNLGLSPLLHWALTHIDEIPWDFSPPGWWVPALSASHGEDAPVPSPSMWPCVGFALVCLSSSCAGHLSSGPSTPDAAH